VRAQLQEQLKLPAAAGPAEMAQLNNALRLLAKWRSVLIQNTLLQQHGTRVLQGPLAGLDFLAQSAEGCHIAKLLGCYEQPLQPHIEHAIRQDYPLVLNIGCAEGYYAVGLARRMAATRVLAFDVDPRAQDTCRALAQKNGVAERVQVRALFGTQDFDGYRDQRVLVLCDIEGAESALLAPVAAGKARRGLGNTLGAAADVQEDGHEKGSTKSTKWRGVCCWRARCVNTSDASR